MSLPGSCSSAPPDAPSAGAARSETGAEPPCGLVLFGDSWFDEDFQPGYRPWPVLVAGKLKIPVYNCARHASESTCLRRQLARAEEVVPRQGREQMMCLVHVGGNDFIGAQKNYNPFARGNCWPWFITGGFRRKLDRVAEHIQVMLEALFAAGFRRFGVADI